MIQFAKCSTQWQSGIIKLEKGVSAFLEAEEIARLAVEAAAEKQAGDIAMLDIKEVCSFADYFVICSGDTKRHIEAIWQGIDEVLRQNGAKPHHSEGTSDSGWMLADFGSVIIHIFAPAERDYYQLDKLWDKAIPVIRIQ
jgi:ribosome-associated protein